MSGGTNPVATFAQSNFNVDTATVYKTKIDSNSIVMQRIVDNFAPRQAASPNMTVVLDAGHVFKGTTLTEVASQTTGTFTAPGGNPRIDRVYIDRFTGAVGVATGTPAGSPAAPAIPSGKIPIAQVLLQTSSVSITNSMITDERDLAALGRGLAGEENIGAWLKDDGAGNLTLNVNATLLDDGAGKLTTGLTTEQTIASAATCDLGSKTSNVLQITGTTGITSFGSSASTANPLYFLRFTGALTLTYNATSMILPGAANITTAAGDTAVAKYEGSGNWRVLQYTVAAPGVTAGSYANANVTVNAQGAVTAASNGVSHGLVFLGSATASASATVDLTSLLSSTYDDYEIIIELLKPATLGNDLWLRTSSNNSTFDASSSQYLTTVEEINSGSSAASISNLSGTFATQVTMIQNIANTKTVNAVVRLYGVNDTANNKTFTFEGTYFDGTNLHKYQGGGARLSNSAIEAVRFMMSSGNISSGTFKVYGIAKS